MKKDKLLNVIMIISMAVILSSALLIAGWIKGNNVKKHLEDSSATYDVEEGIGQTTKSPEDEYAETGDKKDVEIANNEDSKDSIGKTDSGENNTGKTDTGKTDTGKTDTGKTYMGKTDTGKTDTGKIDTSKTDMGTTNTGKTDTGKTDTGKTDTGKTDTGKTDTGKTDTGKTDTGKTDTGKANGEGYCTITVRCDTILSNMGNLKEGKEGYVPSSGVVLKTTKYKIDGDDTVYDILIRALDDAGIQYEYSWTPMYNSYYIEGINNLYEFDCGEQSGWMYKVNGVYPNYGCSSYTLKNNDVISWNYTCNGLGEDLGATVY